MTEKIGPKEAQVKALREARAKRGKIGIGGLRDAVDAALKRQQAKAEAKKKGRRRG